MGWASRGRRRRLEDDPGPSRSLERYIERIRRLNLNSGIPGVVSVDHPETMSEVILDFAHPWIPEDCHPKRQVALIGLAILAWNLATAEPDSATKRKKLLEETVGEILRDRSTLLNDDVLHRLLIDMIAHKLRHFSENRRLVIDYEIVDEGGDLRFNVASTIVASNNESAASEAS